MESGPGIKSCERRAGAGKPLNILIFNQVWFANELRARGHNVVTVSCPGQGFDLDIAEPGIHLDEILSRLPDGFTPDRIVVLDDSSTPCFTGLEESSIPSVFLSVDTHHHYRWHRSYAELFDLVLVAQRSFIEVGHFAHPAVEWFPLWAPRVPEPAAARDLDAVFRGNLDAKLHPRRAEFFKRFCELVPCDVKGGDWASAFSRAKIVVNQAVGNDLNFRNFEALISGALLVTPRLWNGLDLLFEDRVELVMYEPDSPESAAELTRYYLEHEAEREEIAKRGFEKALSEHTPAARAETLEAHLLSLTRITRPRRRIAAFMSFVPSLLSVSRNSDSKGALRLFKLVLSILRRALEANERLEDGDEMSAGMLLLLFLQGAGEFDLALTLSRALSASHNDELLFLFELSALLGMKKDGEALERAKQFSISPEELLASVPRLLNEVRERVHQTLGAM